MKNQQIMALLLCIVSLMLSCSDNDEFRDIESALNEVNTELISNNPVIYIIPREGCGGCIQNATHQLVNGIDTLNGAIVFTGVGDLKLLKLQLGKDFFDRKNVYLDEADVLMNLKISSIYPRTLTLKNNHVSRIEVFSQ